MKIPDKQDKTFNQELFNSGIEEAAQYIEQQIEIEYTNKTLKFLASRIRTFKLK